MPLSKDEIKSNIKDFINAMITDDETQAAESFHDALQAKMQTRFNGTSDTDLGADEGDTDTGDAK